VGGVLLDRPFRIRRLGHFGLNVDRIEEGIPDLLIEDSEELDPATWSEIMKKHGK